MTKLEELKAAYVAAEAAWDAYDAAYDAYQAELDNTEENTND